MYCQVAGFGKTTVMTQWLARIQEMGREPAWLSLDKTDNDPQCFFANLLASIKIASSESVFEDIDLDKPSTATNHASTTCI